MVIAYATLRFALIRLWTSVWTGERLSMKVLFGTRSSGSNVDSVFISPPVKACTSRYDNSLCESFIHGELCRHTLDLATCAIVGFKVDYNLDAAVNDIVDRTDLTGLFVTGAHVYTLADLSESMFVCGLCPYILITC